jgi:hypothetical protein
LKFLYGKLGKGRKKEKGARKEGKERRAVVSKQPSSIAEIR